MNIYVGNLSYEVTQEDLREAFKAFGEIESVKLYTRRSNGFGFVEMTNNEEANAAIEDLDGEELKGRTIKVNKAKPRSDSRGPGGYRGPGRHGGSRF